MEEELRIGNRHLEKANNAKQKFERDLDEVSALNRGVSMYKGGTYDSLVGG